MELGRYYAIQLVAFSTTRLNQNLSPGHVCCMLNGQQTGRPHSCLCGCVLGEASPRMAREELAFLLDCLSASSTTSWWSQHFGCFSTLLEEDMPPLTASFPLVEICAVAYFTLHYTGVWSFLQVQGPCHYINNVFGVLTDEFYKITKWSEPFVERLLFCAIWCGQRTKFTH